LWEQFKDKICDDLYHLIPCIYPHLPNPSDEDVFDYGLYLLDKLLTKSQKHLIDFPSMPAIIKEWGVIADNALLHEQLDYNPVELHERVEDDVKKFNAEQKAVFTAVMASMDGRQSKSFFLQSVGGGGKTFVCNTVAAAVRSKGMVALCVASSGIAALLLDGGQTSHSRFRIPIPVLDNSVCTIKKNTHLHEVLKATGIIIWDEVPMQHRHCIEALERTLRDVMGNTAQFGGITLLFGGDFRQILPVVP